MKTYRWFFIMLMVIFVFGCAKGGTYLIHLQYQPVKEFASLAGKIGPTLSLAPFKDERPDQLYIGSHTPNEGPLSYFKTDPFPLSQAMMDSISKAFSHYGVKTLPVKAWDGQPESLKHFETDSVLMIEVKSFWTEGKAGTFRTTLKTSMQLVIHLGVKKEKKVFTKTVEVEKEATFARLTPERVETAVNQALADILNAFLSSPY